MYMYLSPEYVYVRGGCTCVVRVVPVCSWTFVFTF